MGKILIIDDSETARNDVAKILTKENFDLIFASTGQEGLEILQKKNTEIDLVLSDINMPEMDGLTMWETLHDLKVSNLPPILMITTETSEAIRNKARKLGVSGWVFKPVDAKSLVTSIKHVIAKNKDAKKDA